MNNMNQQSGSSKIITLVVLALLAIAGLAYYAINSNKANNTMDKTTQTAVATPADGVDTVESANKLVIEPGNPVVAKVNGKDVNRLDVFNFIQSLPPETRQLPVEQLFPAALEQVINAKVIESKTSNVRLDGNPVVQQQLAEARKNIMRTVYIQQQIDERLTDERVAQAYEQYKSTFPDVMEVKARHILVDEEAKAKDMIKQLNDGASFEKLATENSKDGTAENGGLVGYFTKTEVVPEFADAAFTMEVGTYSMKPVKTEFGYHVVKLEEKRQRPPAELEQVKPAIQAQLRQVILNEVVNDWRGKTTVERFDINGKALEDAAPSEG